MIPLPNKAIVLGQLKDKLMGVSPYRDPFLYFLPEYITRDKLKNIDTEAIMRFVNACVRHDQLPLISDALRILNQIVDPEKGDFIQPRPQFFNDNRHFFWKELGSHTTALEVIEHVFNKSCFEISLHR